MTLLCHMVHFDAFCPGKYLVTHQFYSNYLANVGRFQFSWNLPSPQENFVILITCKEHLLKFPVCGMGFVFQRQILLQVGFKLGVMTRYHLLKTRFWLLRLDMGQAKLLNHILYMLILFVTWCFEVSKCLKPKTSTHVMFRKM